MANYSLFIICNYWGLRWSELAHRTSVSSTLSEQCNYLRNSFAHPGRNIIWWQCCAYDGMKPLSSCATPICIAGHGLQLKFFFVFLPFSANLPVYHQVLKFVPIHDMSTEREPNERQKYTSLVQMFLCIIGFLLSLRGLCLYSILLISCITNKNFLIATPVISWSTSTKAFALACKQANFM